MNEKDAAADASCYDATERVAEIRRLFASIRLVLDHMVQDLAAPDGKTPARAALAKISELQSAHLKVLAAEEAFNEQQAQSAEPDSIDYEAIRFEIGRKLDRIRATIDPAALREEPDPDRSGGSPLPV